MISSEAFRKMALSFPGTEENPHFERRAFKVTGRRIFATLLEEQQSANIVLTPAEQAVYCSFDKKGVYPVPNKFGLHGWTTFDLTKLPAELVSDALYTAYKLVLDTSVKKKSKKK